MTRRYKGPPGETGAVIRHIRQEQGLSLRSLASRAGVRAQTLVEIEKGGVSPQWRTLRKIADVLEVSETTLRHCTLAMVSGKAAPVRKVSKG